MSGTRTRFECSRCHELFVEETGHEFFMRDWPILCLACNVVIQSGPNVIECWEHLEKEEVERALNDKNALPKRKAAIDAKEKMKKMR